MPFLLWRGTDGSSAIASQGGVAARYFALRHPLPVRRIIRRIQARASRLATLAKSELCGVVLSRSESGSDAPAWVEPIAKAIDIDVSDWLLLSGPDADDKRIAFLFAGRDQYPVAVAKLAKSPSAAARVERGYRALEKLRVAGLAARRLVPEPLALLSGPDGGVASVERAVRGNWLDGALRRGNEGHYVASMTDWLIEIGRVTRNESPDDATAPYTHEIVDRFRENVTGLIDPGFLQEACALATVGQPRSTVFEHHDCAPWNFYLTPANHLVAFDWDNANPRGIPGFDLVQALGYLAFSLDGALGSRRFADAFHRGETGRLGEIRRQCRARYASAVGIDDTALRGIRAFAWMRLSNDEIEARRRKRKPLGAGEIESSMLGAWLAEAGSALAAH